MVELIQDFLTGVRIPGGTLLAAIGSRLPLLVVLTGTYVLMPLITHRRHPALNRDGSEGFLVQLCMGFGFFFVSIPAIELVTPLLGLHTYSQWAALIALILFMGVGSYSAAYIPKASGRRRSNKLGLLASLLVLYLFALPPLLSRLSDLPESLRIAGSVALVGPLGVMLGNTWPSALVPRKRRSVWSWASCSAIPVMASIAAISLFFAGGFAVTLFSGFAVYVLALGLAVLREPFFREAPSHRYTIPE
ncbi:MAG: hypothetical protein C4532_14640 [Candidatus Abyssobacteria bacterium SURF_17]|uniref:Uncharacterized protein n=1 Tax=Candidatus Abyssobacteria bacterium SURF_17 TaxID=2093361 RepID=A0A419ETW1_9BACT|nr:MAG: hypothetical protein C4532_14640 [Candidatus Abyssubacteria bacterium SURF_17]